MFSEWIQFELAYVYTRHSVNVAVDGGCNMARRNILTSLRLKAPVNRTLGLSHWPRGAR